MMNSLSRDISDRSIDSRTCFCDSLSGGGFGRENRQVLFFVRFAAPFGSTQFKPVIGVNQAVTITGTGRVASQIVRRRYGT